MTYIGIGPANSALVSTGSTVEYTTSPTMAGQFECSGLTNNAYLGVRYHSVVRGIDPYPAVVGPDEFYYSVDTTLGSYIIDLPDNPGFNRMFIIKDKMGTAATNNITIQSLLGEALFDGQPTVVISTNYGSIRCIFNGTNYELF